MKYFPLKDNFVFLLMHTRTIQSLDENVLKDPILLEIQSYANVLARDYVIPIYTSKNDERIERINKNHFVGEFYEYCVGYQSKFVNKSQHVTNINSPTSNWVIQQMKYLNDNYPGKYVWQMRKLFEEAVILFVIEQTEHFTEDQKSKRFKMIFNTDIKHECKTYMDYLKFFQGMYTSNIYEFMFNKFKAIR